MVVELKQDQNIDKKINIRNYVTKLNRCYETISGKYYTISVELEFKRCIKRILGICVKSETYKKLVEIPYSFHKEIFDEVFDPLNVVHESELYKEFNLYIPKNVKTEEDWKEFCSSIISKYKQILIPVEKDFTVKIDFNFKIKDLIYDECPIVKVIPVNKSPLVTFDQIGNFLFKDVKNKKAREKYTYYLKETINDRATGYYFDYDAYEYNRYELKVTNNRLIFHSHDVFYRMKKYKDIIKFVERDIKMELLSAVREVRKWYTVVE